MRWAEGRLIRQEPTASSSDRRPRTFWCASVARRIGTLGS